MQHRINTFPILEIASYETALPVYVVAWHVRSVRAIREAGLDEETITRIEFGNGDILDTSDSVQDVLSAIDATLQPVFDCLIAMTSPTK
jgi:hypothetical protein